MFRRVAPRPGNVWGQVGGSDVKLETCTKPRPSQEGRRPERHRGTSLDIWRRTRPVSPATSSRIPRHFPECGFEPDGSFVVAFTADTDRHLEAMRALVDAPDRVTVVQFRYTYQHLLDLTHRIVSILGTADGLSNWGPDVKADKVYVEVLPERIGEVRRILGDTNPDDVYVEPGTPVRTL